MPARFADIQDTALNSGCVYLSGLSKALALHALQVLSHYGYWRGEDGDYVDDASWDEIDNAVSVAMTEVMSIVDCAAGGSSVIGSIIAVATETAPAGTLICDGSTYNRVDYPDLFAALASEYIIDPDTFKVPDLTERMIIGTGTTFTMDASGGEVEHTLTESEMPSHQHALAHDIAVVLGTLNRELRTGTDVRLRSDNTGSTGGDSPHNNMPPYRALTYVIVYQ